jgi:4'-phosphopantetheinyl transferase
VAECIPTPRSADALQGSLAMLTNDERARAVRFRHEADRQDFAAAHVAARRCVGRLVGEAASEIVLRQHCRSCGGPHGRPAVDGLPEVYVTMAHTRGYVAAIAGWEPVGIDVEIARPTGVVSSAVILSERERAFVTSAADPGVAFTQIWVRKEAVLKAHDLDLADLPLFDTVDDSLRLRSKVVGLHIRQLPTDFGFVAASATTSDSS